MNDKSPNFNFMATGAGSVPFSDTKDTCREILERLPDIPYWPQFVKRSHLEDMIIQCEEGLPLLEIRGEKRSLVLSSVSDTENELVNFYDRFLAVDTDYFAISESHASGLYTLLDLVSEQKGGETLFIKGQSVGPITFAASILDLDGKPVIHNQEFSEAMFRGIAIKALWQVKHLEKSNRRPIIFLDEPYLSGFGSAFSPIQRHEVVNALRLVIDYLKENSQALIGIHCCGNTDWPMLFEAGPDIINFDAFDYMDYFLLFPDEIERFLLNGGTVAWGIVPTANFSDEESVDRLFSRLENGLNRVKEWGVSDELIAQRSIITSSCGMGTMPTENAKKVLELLSELSEKCRHHFEKC